MGGVDRGWVFMEERGCVHGGRMVCMVGRGCVHGGRTVCRMITGCMHVGRKEVGVPVGGKVHGGRIVYNVHGLFFSRRVYCMYMVGAGCVQVGRRM